MFSTKQNVLFIILWLSVTSAHGDFSESSVFSLNTLSPSPVLSSVFTANTTLFKTVQLSGIFPCSTIHIDQQASDIFICDSLPRLYGSGLFITDTMTVPMDTNTNGLPNIWEMRYFGGTTVANAVDDNDHDGANNLAEYITGTNPTNSGSLFLVQLIDSARHIEWATVQDRIYTVQHSSNLATPFTNITDRAGTGGDMSFSTPEEQQGFYRVNVRLP